jgi:hypothetical protein
MICPPVTALDDISLAHLQPLVGRSFHTRDLADRLVALRLISVTDIRPRPKHDPARDPVTNGALEAMSETAMDAPTRRILPLDPMACRPFSLLFLGPESHPLAEGYYDLELPWLPLPGLQLTPLGPSGGAAGTGLLYEAVLD